MSEAPFTLSQDESDTILRNLKAWPKPTAAQVRTAVLEEKFITPAAVDRSATKTLTGMAEAFAIGVKSGRLFDMGYLPNSVLKSESGRAGELFLAGHIGHPFTEPYCFFHTWDADSAGDAEDHALARELGIGECGSLYVVDPLDWHKYAGNAFDAGSFMVCEAQAVRVFNGEMLLIGDVAWVAVARGPDGKAGYRAGRVIRSALNGSGTDGAAVGNVMDPVMSCMLLLATDGIEVRTIEAPDKLNKHRLKAGKLAIPSHYRVQTEGYVTALTNRRSRRAANDGHHASPVPHLRRGHIRHLHEMHGGGTIFVKDAVINLKDPEAPLVRSFYQRRMEATAD
jgi:hypothetical protein